MLRDDARGLFSRAYSGDANFDAEADSRRLRSEYGKRDCAAICEAESAAHAGSLGGGTRAVLLGRIGEGSGTCVGDRGRDCGDGDGDGQRESKGQGDLEALARQTLFAKAWRFGVLRAEEVMSGKCSKRKTTVLQATRRLLRRLW